MANVLVVEDDIALSRAYELILTKEGHAVRAAMNGQEALDAAAEFKPMVILLDLLMPVMSGLDFLKAYDAPAKHPKTKIIILSNVGDEKEAQKGLAMGAYKYIVKAHASPRELAVLVNHLINKNLAKKPV